MVGFREEFFDSLVSANFIGGWSSVPSLVCDVLPLDGSFDSVLAHNGLFRIGTFADFVFGEALPTRFAGDTIGEREQTECFLVNAVARGIFWFYPGPLFGHFFVVCFLVGTDYFLPTFFVCSS